MGNRAGIWGNRGKKNQMAQGQEFFSDGCLVLGNVEKRMRMEE